MDFPLSIVPTIRQSTGCINSRNFKYDRLAENSPLMRTTIRGKGTPNYEVDNFLGVLEVYIHQARGIHNICIYQEQDVYAKLFLTNDPETTISTKIVYKGGRNPIFKEKICLNVKQFDSSIRCEIWMLSRARNYLEDQLLGFALVSVYEVLHNGKLEKAISLSSSDVCHSPAGFVELSISYAGVLPVMILNPATQTTSNTTYSGLLDFETIKSNSIALDMIEFPDPKIILENHQMAEEYYFATPPTSLISTLISFDGGYGAMPGFVAQSGDDFLTNSSRCPSATRMGTVNNTDEHEVVKQDIVDMYLKSRQQTNDSLAQMKLPNSSGARLFYGSRAFF